MDTYTRLNVIEVDATLKVRVRIVHTILYPYGF